MGPSRISRDWKDTQLVAEFLHERNPFEYGDVFATLPMVFMQTHQSITTMLKPLVKAF